MKRLPGLFPAAALLAAALLAQGGLAAPPLPLATVNDDVITPEELKDAFVRRHGGHQKFLAGEVEIRKMLDVVVEQRLLIQEAYRLDLQSIPAIVEVTKKDLDRKMVEYYVRKEIEEKAKPTEEEIRAAWEKNTGETLAVREVVVEQKSDAEELRKELLVSGDFDGAARDCSVAPSKVYGGLLNAVGWGMLDPRWEEAVFPLSPGGVAPVVRGKEGWSVVRLESRSAVERPDYVKAKPRIEGILKRRKLEEREKALSEYLWGKYHASLSGFDRTPAALGRAVRSTPDAVLATWDGGSLTVKEFVLGLDMKTLAMLPPDQMAERLDHLLRQTVNESLALLEARALKLESAPEVAAAVTRYREELMEGALYSDFILKDLSVSDAEVRAWFDAHRKELVVPEKRRVAHIVVATCAEAEPLRKRIESGEPFVELVKAYSTDKESVKKGGDLGFVEKKQTPKEFEAILALKEGEVSEPIPSKFGCHLIKVTKIVPERPMEFDESKDDVRKKVLQEKQKEKRAVWVSKLRAASTIKINDAGVKALAKEAAFQ